MVRFELERSMEVLSATPGTLVSWLGDLDAYWTHRTYGPGTFSVFDIVGHLIHGEREDWIPRARLILEHGGARAFEPFDRYTMFTDMRGRAMGGMLDEFTSLREENLEQLRCLGLDESSLSLPGLHPALGPVTMSQLLSAWVVHDLHHLGQVAKAMAHRLRDDVGPWRDYLSIIPR